MKLRNILVLYRFIIIVILYAAINFFCEYDFFYTLDIVLHPYFFSPVLFIYLIMFIVSFYLIESKKYKIILLTDIIFLCIFTFQTVLLLYWAKEDFGEAGWAIFGLSLYIPMYVCFIIWFVRDKKKYKSLAGGD